LSSNRLSSGARDGAWRQWVCCFPSPHWLRKLCLRSPGAAEAEWVIVTGSNIPTAAEVRPNPVDTYRPSDLEKLDVRDATDFLINLPQKLSGTVNQNLPASNQQLYRQIRAAPTALSNPVCETGADFWHK
jgi:hypothetical protein